MCLVFLRSYSLPISIEILNFKMRSNFAQNQKLYLKYIKEISRCKYIIYLIICGDVLCVSHDIGIIIYCNLYLVIKLFR